MKAPPLRWPLPQRDLSVPAFGPKLPAGQELIVPAAAAEARRIAAASTREYNLNAQALLRQRVGEHVAKLRQTGRPPAPTPQEAAASSARARERGILSTLFGADFSPRAPQQADTGARGAVQPLSLVGDVRSFNDQMRAALL